MSIRLSIVKFCHGLFIQGNNYICFCLDEIILIFFNQELFSSLCAGVVTKKCLGNGTWYLHHESLREWSDYRQCVGLEVSHYTSTKSWKGYIFTSICLCACACPLTRVCVSVSLSVHLWIKCRSNQCTNFELVFAKRLHLALARILFKLVTFV